jgi:hypothetical protein
MQKRNEFVEVVQDSSISVDGTREGGEKKEEEVIE